MQCCHVAVFYAQSECHFSGCHTLLGEGGLPNICNESTTLLKATGYRCPEHKCTLQTIFSYLSQKMLARIVGTRLMLPFVRKKCLTLIIFVVKAL